MKLKRCTFIRRVTISIDCEEYGEWFHFACIDLSDTSNDNIHTDVQFICINCNDNLLYDDSNTQSSNLTQDIAFSNLK